MYDCYFAVVDGSCPTFEGANMLHNSQSSLHIEPDCMAVNVVQTSTLVNSADCSFKTNLKEGRIPILTLTGLLPRLLAVAC